LAGTSNRSRYQRRRVTPTYSNNSVRRTYDLLRSTLPGMGPDAQLVEEELICSFSASRNTIRIVLQLLAAQGLVSRGPKVGTISSASTVLPLDEVMPIPDQNERQSMHGQVLESLVIPAPAVVASRLQIPEGAPVAMIEGLVIADQTPIALSVSYVALPSGLGERERFGRSDPDPIAFLEQQLHVDVVSSDAVVAAIACDEQSAELLELSEGDPILFCQDLFRDEKGRPRAITQTRYRGDRVTMSATARRRGLGQEPSARLRSSSGVMELERG
jgi:GntR family transcriptional regulator